MAHTRRAAASVAANTSVRSRSHTTKSKEPLVIAPAQKVHRAPRLTRKPLSTLDANTLSVTKAKRPQDKQGKAKRPPLKKAAPQSPAEVLDVSLSPPLTIPTQPLNSLQPTVESHHDGNNIPAETPSAIEHSILALKNFRRRPRQPSMLNMVKQRFASARSSSVAPEVPVFDSDDSIDLDDFLPDAAGTPMHSSGPVILAQSLHDGHASQPLSSKRKRSRDGPESSGSMDTVDRSLAKYRKLVSQSSDGSIATDDDELQVPASQASRIRSTPERLQDEHETTLNITELAAGTSPISASSDLSPLRPGTQHSDIYAPPMSQLTPPRKTRTAAKAIVAPTSAVLQNLLPKRRKRFNTDRPVPTLRLSDEQDDGHYDVPSSPASADLDTSEYAHAGSKKTSKSRAEKRTAIRRKKPNAARKGRDAADAGSRSRTYSRRKADEQVDDNAGQDNDLVGLSMTVEQALSSKELQAARRKFQEIDEWEMEFETLTTEEARSSSQNWR